MVVTASKDKTKEELLKNLSERREALEKYLQFLRSTSAIKINVGRKKK